MSTDNLKQTLTDLHAALASGAPLDPELVQMLKVLDADIRTALTRQATAAVPVHVAGQPLSAETGSGEHTPRALPGVSTSAASSAGVSSTADDTDGLTSRAQALSAKFAARHPHLEPVLRELTDTLQRIGI